MRDRKEIPGVHEKDFRESPQTATWGLIRRDLESPGKQDLEGDRRGKREDQRSRNQSRYPRGGEAGESASRIRGGGEERSESVIRGGSNSRGLEKSLGSPTELRKYKLGGGSASAS